jgi:hypothetical protein
MHSVTMPRFSPSRFIEWSSLVVRIAPVAPIGWHPLEGESPETSEWTSFYPEAQAILDQMPRRGVSVVLGPSGQQYAPTRFANIVRKVANEAGLPGFTLDACRHGEDAPNGTVVSRLRQADAIARLGGDARAHAHRLSNTE